MTDHPVTDAAGSVTHGDSPLAQSATDPSRVVRAALGAVRGALGGLGQTLWPGAAEDLDGRVVAITGAGSGIGRALAVTLAGHGCRLALCDIDVDGLAGTLAVLPAGVDVDAAVVDVADRQVVRSWADQVSSRFGGTDVVINNAGVAQAATVAGLRYDDLERTLAVNLLGVVHCTKAFLPLLSEAPAGHLVNVASIFGVIAVPTQSAYVMSKFAVRGFTETLAQELALQGSSVTVSLVLPGGVATRIAASATVGDTEGLLQAERLADDFGAVALTSPTRASEIIVAGIRRRRPRILVGPDARVFDRLTRTLPVGYQHLVTGWMRSWQ